MTNGELKDLIIAAGYTHSWDSDYNRDVFCKTNMMVGGIPTKLEVYVDYYSATVSWWYEPTKQISAFQYLEKLTWDSFREMANNLVIKNKRLLKKNNHFVAYSDGSGDNKNPNRPGGAAFIILNEDGTEYMRASKGYMNVTNNQMELMAIIGIVNSLPHSSAVTIYSDSQYCQMALYGHNPQKNLDLIAQYHSIVRSKQLQVQINWVKGHNGNRYNEECDQMAKAEYEKMNASVAVKIPIKPAKTLKKDDDLYYSQITTKGRRKKVKK